MKKRQMGWEDWIMEEVRHLLYNVENGTLWYGSEPENFSHCAVYSGGVIPFLPESDFISLVKGEFHF
ncbi:MAG: hypothetical protein IJP31_12675 [Lachnospiraceae bacterium]|nr:hypothetical protein [Lachnospiraceae bacterium]